jgi:hypothetical protein
VETANYGNFSSCMTWHGRVGYRWYESSPRWPSRRNVVRKRGPADVYSLADDHGNERRQQEEMRIRQNGTGKYTVRSVKRESVANRQALFLGMVV